MIWDTFKFGSLTHGNIGEADSYYVSFHWSLSIPPKTIRKREVFWCVQGHRKGSVVCNGTMKRISKCPFYSFSCRDGFNCQYFYLCQAKKAGSVTFATSKLKLEIVLAELMISAFYKLWMLHLTKLLNIFRAFYLWVS